MRTDVIVNDISSIVATLGLMPLVAVGAEVIFDLNALPNAVYHPGFALGGITLSLVALATKAVLLRPFIFNSNPFDRYIAKAIR